MSVSPLDLPFGTLPDPDELLRAAIKWHFSEETGTPFWLRKLSTLNFDPLIDITSYQQLALFPNVSAELRTVPIEDLIPRGYKQHTSIAGIFESGGTTGSPKRVICTQDWLELLVKWSNANLIDHGFPQGENWLSITPSGPHFVGHLCQASAITYGKRNFRIDLDPRWVKKLIAEKKHQEADAYAEHLIDQAECILATQNIGILTITPPLLERMVRRPHLVDLINSNIKAIRWGGTQMDKESRYLYRTEIFPSIPLYGHYGNTMVLGIAGERAGTQAHEPCIFDAFSPYISYSVVDKSTHQPVAYGERGQVITHHISKSLFLPNNLERDMATRFPGPNHQVGDSVADITPVPSFEDEAVIEGVY